MNDSQTFIVIEDLEGCSKDLLPARIDLEERRVAKCYELTNTRGNPFEKVTHSKGYLVPHVLV